MTYSCDIEWKGNDRPSEEDLIKGSEIIHTFIGYVPQLRGYIRDDVFLRLCPVAQGVNDIKKVSDDDHVFRIKVDDELCWVVGFKLAWYICKQDYKLTVNGWKMPVYIGDETDIPVFSRCEQLMNGSLVYIDVLCNGLAINNPSRKYVDPNK